MRIWNMEFGIWNFTVATDTKLFIAAPVSYFLFAVSSQPEAKL